MFDWYTTLIGIGLTIGGFLFGFIWLYHYDLREFGFWLLTLLAIFATVCILFGMYCIYIGLGF